MASCIVAVRVKLTPTSAECQAAEIMVGHEKPEMRAALLEKFGELIVKRLAHGDEMHGLRTLN